MDKFTQIGSEISPKINYHKSEIILLVLIIILNSIIALFGITTRSLFNDELFSLDLAISDFNRLISITTSDVHPPLYYLFLSGWVLYNSQM